MLHRTLQCLPSRHVTARNRIRPKAHQYKEVSTWHNQATGRTGRQGELPKRRSPTLARFNPESTLHTKGTSSFAYKWWHTLGPHLPQVAPSGYVPPSPKGLLPNPMWTPEFASAILALSDEELAKRITARFTVLIHEETQRDGYELRRLDFEGRPTEALPDQGVVDQFVLAEETLRERIIGQLVETDFRLTVTSSDREHLRTVENITRFILAHVTVARPPPRTDVTDAVRDVLAAQPVQPTLGFQHALPQNPHKDPTLHEWERLFHHDWQFGKAVYAPRSSESTTGNLTWLRAKQAQDARNAFEEHVKSGAAHREHMARIQAAAAVTRAEDD